MGRHVGNLGGYEVRDELVEPAHFDLPVQSPKVGASQIVRLYSPARHRHPIALGAIGFAGLGVSRLAKMAIRDAPVIVVYNLTIEESM